MQQTLDIAKCRTAINELAEYDHVFLTEEGAKYFGDIFGFKPRTYLAHATAHRDPKGLTLNDGKKSARGIAAEELAMQICRHLKVHYEEKMGRGFQLQSCLLALEAFFQ